MKIGSFASIRVKLIALIALTLAPSITLSFFTAEEQRAQATIDAENNALALARLAASRHSSIVANARQLLSLLADVPEVRGTDRGACDAFLSRLLRDNPAYANFGVIEHDGRLWSSAYPSQDKLVLTDRAFFREAISERGFVAGPYSMSATTGRPSVSYGYPVIGEGGEVERVVFAAVDLTPFRQLAAETHLPLGTALTVLDAEGYVLLRDPDPESWAGKRVNDVPLVRRILSEHEGVAYAAGIDGKRRLYGFTPLSGAFGREAFVSVGIPEQEAFRAANETLRRNIALLVAVAVASLLAAWIGSEALLLRRLRGVVRAAARLADGVLTERAEVEGADEVSQLSEAFNEMAARLHSLVEREQRDRAALAQEVERLVGRRTRELSELNRLGEMLQASATIDDALGVTAGAAERLFLGAAGGLFLINSSRSTLETAARWGSGLVREGGVFVPDDCWALRRGRLHATEEVSCRHLDLDGRRTLCAPLTGHGETLGVITVERVSGPAGDELSGLVVTVAEQVALALANLRLRESLRLQSIRDPLTGLFNRRYMEETLERELRRSARSQVPLCVLMLDADHFKRLNDTFGHEAGDVVLRELGTLLKGSVRGGDIACRIGGEELVLLLPETSLEEGTRRAEQLRAEVARMVVTHRGVVVGPVTLSMGVAAYPVHGSTGEALLRAADRALYRAKGDGRNRVAAAE